jgi:hypothetical protein
MFGGYMTEFVPEVLESLRKSTANKKWKKKHFSFKNLFFRPAAG